MNELVFLKRNDVFTDSLVIAEGTGNEHTSITRLLRNYSGDFNEFGEVLFMDFKSINKAETRGRKQKVYLLNEMHATLLMTYLGNSEVVRAFKKELVKQFYQMRQLLLEKSTQQWLDTRYQGKLTRKAETDTIKRLVEYAKGQGSEHTDKLYKNRLDTIKDVAYLSA